tara:strand:+ start:1491 stop:1760 length:270 start_codon:yes stop_codon:yes gene_type:complete
MSKNISKTHLKSFEKEFDSCNHCKTTMNTLTRSKLEDVTMDWETYRKLDHNYSDIVKNEMSKVTNQKASGRCWGFRCIESYENRFFKKI